MLSDRANKIKMAVTYSPSVGGVSVLSLKSALAELDVEVVDADYRKIVPASEDLDRIYTSKKARNEIFRSAKKKAEDFLQHQDCLMLSGAASMVDSRLYGLLSNENKSIDLARNLAEMALIHVAMQKGMPILGVCGGHQILNVYLGGKLAELNVNELASQKFMEYSAVRIDSSSELGKMVRKEVGSDEEIVERFFGAHNEVVNAVGGSRLINAGKTQNGLCVTNASDYLKVVATADDVNGSIEAVEGQYGAPVMGVQFHPEVGAKGFVNSHSLLPNCVYNRMYQADTSEDVLKNTEILKAFTQAATTYRRKMDLLDQIRGGAKKDNLTQAQSDQVLTNQAIKLNSDRPEKKKPSLLKRIGARILNWIGSLIREISSKWLVKAKIKSLQGKGVNASVGFNKAFSTRNIFMNVAIEKNKSPKKKAHNKRLARSKGVQKRIVFSDHLNKIKVNLSKKHLINSPLAIFSRSQPSASIKSSNSKAMKKMAQAA